MLHVVHGLASYMCTQSETALGSALPEDGRDRNHEMHMLNALEIATGIYYLT